MNLFSRKEVKNKEDRRERKKKREESLSAKE